MYAMRLTWWSLTFYIRFERLQLCIRVLIFRKLTIGFQDWRYKLCLYRHGSFLIAKTSRGDIVLKKLRFGFIWSAWIFFLRSNWFVDIVYLSFSFVFNSQVLRNCTVNLMHGRFVNYLSRNTAITKIKMIRWQITFV